jgi:gluconokinase
MTEVLAVDVGTSSAKAATVGPDGVLGRIGHVAYDPGPELDAEVVRRAALEAAGGEPDAVSCFWHGLLALDAGGRPCSPVYTWLDTRAVEHAGRLAASLDEQAVHARTGCRLHPTFWPAKLLWLREERPELFARAEHFVSFSEYLLGGSQTSASMASATGLLDLARCDWDDELLDAVGIERDRLPAIGDVAAWGDGASANVGSGARTADRACLTVGTSAAYRVLDDAPLRPELFRYLLDAQAPVVGGALSDGGNVLDWLETAIGTAEATDNEHDVLFLPLLGGERSPGWRADARGVIANLSLTTTAGQIARAAREGIAYRIAEIADLIDGVREVVATGGALEDDPEWMQLFADVLERPVVVTAVEEASLRGAGVLELERRGIEVPPPEVSRSFEPRPERFERHRANRERLRWLYTALRSL